MKYFEKILHILNQGAPDSTEKVLIFQYSLEARVDNFSGRFSDNFRDKSLLNDFQGGLSFLKQNYAEILFKTVLIHLLTCFACNVHMLTRRPTNIWEICIIVTTIETERGTRHLKQSDIL